MPTELATDDVPFQNVARTMNKMMEQLQKGYYNFCPSDTWTPNVNLYETEATYHVCVDLAGVEKEKIDVTVHDQRLKLSGRRAVPQLADRPGTGDGDGDPPRVRLHLMEIDHGSFCREVELPDDVRQDRVSAEYRDGLLWIELPKK